MIWGQSYLLTAPFKPKSSSVVSSLGSSAPDFWPMDIQQKMLRCVDHGHMAVHIGRETVFNPLKTMRYSVIFRISRTKETLWQWQIPQFYMDYLHFLRDFPFPHLIQARCSLKNSGLPWYLRPHAVHRWWFNWWVPQLKYSPESTESTDQVWLVFLAHWFAICRVYRYTHNSQTHRFGFPGLRHPRSTFAASGRWPDLASENAPKKNREEIKGTNQIISELFWMKDNLAIWICVAQFSLLTIIIIHHPDCWWTMMNQLAWKTTETPFPGLPAASRWLCAQLAVAPLSLEAAPPWCGKSQDDRTTGRFGGAPMTMETSWNLDMFRSSTDLGVAF